MSRSRSRAVGNRATIDPTFLQSVATNSIRNTRETTFDSVETERLEKLSAGFTEVPVDNLPQRLEKIISDYHSSNAVMLINNSKTLSDSSTALHSILQKFTDIYQCTCDARDNCQPVTDKLRTIDTSKDSDNTSSQNRKSVVEYIEKITRIAKIPEEWIQVVEKPYFNDFTKIDKTYEIIEQITKEINSGSVDPEISGFTIAYERQSELRKLCVTFSNAFASFFSTLVTNNSKIEVLFKMDISCSFIPSFNPKIKKEFSVDIKQHKLLKAIYPYWKYLYWMKQNYPENYQSLLDRSYFPLIIKKLEVSYRDLVTSTLRQYGLLHQSIVKKDVSLFNEPFSSGIEAISEIGRKITDLLSNFYKEIIHAIEVEVTLLQEFWQVSKEDCMKYTGIISKESVSLFEKVNEIVSSFDPYFSILSYSILSARNKKGGLPLVNLITPSQNKYDQLIKHQTKGLKEAKIGTRKTIVLPQVKSFTPFVLNYYKAHSMIEDGDKSILDEMMGQLLDNLNSWLENEVVPKFKHSKRNRLLIVNLNYILENLSKEKCVSESAKFTEKLKQREAAFERSVRTFMKWLTRKTWDKSSAFFNQIKTWKKEAQLTSEMVTFQPSHIDEKFTELCKDMEKRLTPKVNECFVYLGQKFHDDVLKSQILNALIPYIGEVFKKWNAVAMDCYGRELTVSSDKIIELMMDHRI